MNNYFICNESRANGKYDEGMNKFIINNSASLKLRRMIKSPATFYKLRRTEVGANQWISNSFLDGMDSLNAVFGG